MTLVYSVQLHVGVSFEPHRSPNRLACRLAHPSNPLQPPQQFPGAEIIVSDLQSAGVNVRELLQHRIVQDDRITMTLTDSGVFFG